MITLVVDFLVGRPEVDADRIALYGISQGGYWVPRALAFERRVAAGVADPGVYDAFEPWWEALSLELRRLLDAGDQEGFDDAMEEGLRDATPQERQNLAWRAKPYGKSSIFEVFAAARKYTLDGLADRIMTPLLITDPEGEQFWPGQSERLYDAVTASKLLVPFTAAEGADRHCEPMARALVEQRVFDWLDQQLALHTARRLT